MREFTFFEEINVKHLLLNMTYICLGGKVSKVEKFRFLQTCHSYNISATVSFKVSFQFLFLVVSRALVVLD